MTIQYIHKIQILGEKLPGKKGKREREGEKKGGNEGKKGGRKKGNAEHNSTGFLTSNMTVFWIQDGFQGWMYRTTYGTDSRPIFSVAIVLCSSGITNRR